MSHAISANGEPRNYLNETYGIKSWLLTLDHKRIGILYLITLAVFFLVGSMFASLIRFELMTPKGDLVEAETYNKLFTMHGVVMIFFFLIPSIPAVLGNFLIPLQIGARDVAFPRLNLLSYYLYTAGGLFAVLAIIMGGIDTGWTFYTPYSSTYSTSFVSLALVGVFVNGFSSILTGVNFMVTIHKMRAPGMTWFRLPLFIWGHYATSLIQVLGTPVVAITLLLVCFERLFKIGIFDPNYGGDPVLFQHMFWFYSHPAVYIMILPGFAVISDVIACFARKRVFGYSFVAFSSMAIAILGFLVWGHHLFVSGQSTYASMVFSFITFFIAVPTAIKIFNWAFTLYKGSVKLDSPMLYVMGFIGLFTIGGLTGLFLSTLGLDVHLHDTYFVVAHFHYVMVGGMVMGFLCGLHFWWPKMDRAHVLGRGGQARRHVRLRRVQLDLLSPIYLGLPRDASALSRLSRGMASPQHHVHRGCHRPRAGLLADHRLSPLVSVQGREGPRQSVPSQGSRMGHPLAAHSPQL